MSDPLPFPRWTYNLPRLTDAQLGAIGRVIVHWSFLEEYVGVALQLSLGLTYREGLALSLQMRGFRSRIQALYDVWEQKAPAVAEGELKSLVLEIVRLYGARNALAHRPWWSHTDEDLHSFKLDPNQLPFHPPDQWKLAGIDQIAQEIVAAIENLQDFIQRNQTPKPSS